MWRVPTSFPYFSFSLAFQTHPTSLYDNDEKLATLECLGENIQAFLELFYSYQIVPVKLRRLPYYKWLASWAESSAIPCRLYKDAFKKTILEKLLWRQNLVMHFVFRTYPKFENAKSIRIFHFYKGGACCVGHWS